MKKLRSQIKGFRLIPNTSGMRFLNGIYIKDDGSELYIQFAYGDNLHFKPLSETENSL